MSIGKIWEKNNREDKNKIKEMIKDKQTKMQQFMLETLHINNKGEGLT